MERRKFNLTMLLPYIPASECSYEQWIEVGMALKHEGYQAADWDSWSATDPSRYHAGECLRRWNTFKGKTNPITGASITLLAKRHGWKPRSQDHKALRELGWDDVIAEEPNYTFLNPKLMDGQAVADPVNWDPINEACKYIAALFEPDEYVNYVITAAAPKKNEDKLQPAGSGDYGRTAGELIQALKDCKTKYHGDITYALGDYNVDAGVWVRINPVDGKGISNDNVTAFRYALVESDSIPIEMQNEALRKLQLPIAALVHSGGKSLHAIVKVDAKDAKEYQDRVRHLYKVCQDNGLDVDTGNKNPSRLSRLPGVMRHGRKQFLVATNIGKASWEEWSDWICLVNDDMPSMELLGNSWEHMPALAEPLIDGILRKGHKMLLAGPSKAGKSFALIELAIAIAEGVKWLDTFQCAQGRVLYVNLELDRPSCLHRFHDVYAALGLAPNHLNDIVLWNLRGHAIPMDRLAPKLIARAKELRLAAVIIDPIYKVLTGDENSADQMTRFCNQFDKICTELGCSTIYCHHHSKGMQGFKKSMDRASGSGVFARDPDAMLDMIQLQVMPDTDNPDLTPEDYRRSAWRITGTLREFPPFQPVNVQFCWPVHRLDKSGVLAMAAEEGSYEGRRQKGSRRGGESMKGKKESNQDRLPTAFSAMADKNGEAKIDDVAEYLGVSDRTVRRYLKQQEELILQDNIIKLNTNKNKLSDE